MQRDLLQLHQRAKARQFDLNQVAPLRKARKILRVSIPAERNFQALRSQKRYGRVTFSQPFPSDL